MAVFFGRRFLLSFLCKKTSSVSFFDFESFLLSPDSEDDVEDDDDDDVESELVDDDSDEVDDGDDDDEADEAAFLVASLFF